MAYPPAPGDLVIATGALEQNVALFQIVIDPDVADCAGHRHVARGPRIAAMPVTNDSRFGSSPFEVGISGMDMMLDVVADARANKSHIAALPASGDRGMAAKAFEQDTALLQIVTDLVANTRAEHRHVTAGSLVTAVPSAVDHIARTGSLEVRISGPGNMLNVVAGARATEHHVTVTAAPGNLVAPSSTCETDVP